MKDQFYTKYKHKIIKLETIGTGNNKKVEQLYDKIKLKRINRDTLVKDSSL